MVRRISDFSEIPKASNNTSDSTVAIGGPNGSAPHSLEDIIKESQITAEEWDNGERIGGGTSFAYATWDTASLISNNPALRTRLVTRTDGAEKTEYMTENDPSILLSELTGKIKFDLTWMGKNYTSVPCANIAYVIRESDGAFVGEYFDALYSASDDKGYRHIRHGHTCPSAAPHMGSGAAHRLVSTSPQALAASCKTASAMICRCLAVSR